MGLICSSETNKASPTEERPSLACCKEGDEEVPSKISCSSETRCCKAETNSETCDLVKPVEGNSNSLMYVPFRSRKLEIIPAKVLTESEPSHSVIGNDQKVQGFRGGVSSQRRNINNIPRMASASSLPNPVTPFKKFFSKASARPGNFSPQKVVVKAPKSEDLTNHHCGSEYPHSAQPSPVSTPRYKNKNHRRKTNQLSRTLHPNSSSQGLRRSSLNNAVEVYMDSARSGSSGRLCDSDLEVRRGDDWAAQLPCHLKLVRSSSCQTVPDEEAKFSHSTSLKSGSGSPDSSCLLTMQHLEVSGSGPESVTEAAVTQYLQERPQFLDQYLMEHVDLETLERWMIRRSQRDKLRQTNGAVDASLSNSKIVRKTSLSRWKFCVHADKRKMLTELTASLQSRPSKRRALLELSHCIASATNADGCNLYLLNEADASVLELCTDQSNGEAGSEEAKWSTQVESGGYLCAWVASSRQSERVSCPVNDPRFPNGTPANQDECEHLLCVPVVQSGGTLEGVMEFYRGPNGDPFYEEDEEIVNSYLVWGAIALHYSELYKNMLQQKTLNDFMLSVVKSIFQDMVSMDNLILKVMNFAQTLVNADRASLFLLDSKSKHLYARIFDVGCAADDCDQAKATEEIRFPVGTGIAGIVAQTGEVLNIPDAYADARFNRSVDQQTGYHTKNILCMPIYIRGNVIGVMQMVNKNTGTFTKEDEESFEMFAVYCGLALHHAKLYDKIRRSEQKYKVALEVLGYHNSCTDDDIVELQSEEACLDVALDDFYFSSLEINDLDKVRHTIFMFVDLFGLSRFEKESLIRFTLTIKKNYRRVPYHNWSHGFSVCNAMYAIIKHNPTVFKPLECLSLFIGALCHDLDHRGKNNKFMLETESPLAAIYTTSTLERHHFNQTITILQQEGHNIFSKLTSTEYKQVLSNIKHCILATDLALFFPTKAKLSRLVDENAFDWNNLEHRLLVEAITMTACDLCASTKPWDVQVETVKVIFEEFYEQGDAEKAAGKTPMAMMDREKVSEQPMSQVGFLKGICIPCYELLLKLVPMSRPMLEGCQANYERWQNIADTTKKKLEEARAKVKEIEDQQ